MRHLQWDRVRGGRHAGAVVPNGRRVIGNSRSNWPQCVPRKIKPGANCHSVVRAIYAAMNESQCTYEMMAERSGVSTSAIASMRTHGPGYFANVEAMANVVGLTLRAAKRYGAGK